MAFGLVSLLQPCHEVVALHRIHRAVDVPDLQIHGRLRKESKLVEPLGDVIGAPDRASEHHRGLHRPGIGVLQRLVVGHVLGQGVQASPDQSVHVGIDLLVGHRPPARDALGHLASPEREYHDLVVCEQLLLDGLPEGDVVELLPVHGLVVHGAYDSRDVLGLLLPLDPVYPRRGGHVKALGPGDVAVAVDLDESALVRFRERHSRCAVSLVADDQVELRESELLRLDDGIDGLVGGEHDGQLARVAVLQDLVRVRGGGKS